MPVRMCLQVFMDRVCLFSISTNRLLVTEQMVFPFF